MLRIFARTNSSLTVDGNTASNSKEKANLLNRYLCSLLRTLPIFLLVMASHTLQCQTLQSLVKLLESLDPSKASGSDSIPTRIAIKFWANEVAPTLTINP